MEEHALGETLKEGKRLLVISPWLLATLLADPKINDRKDMKNGISLKDTRVSLQSLKALSAKRNPTCSPKFILSMSILRRLAVCDIVQQFFLTRGLVFLALMTLWPSYKVTLA